MRACATGQDKPCDTSGRALRSRGQINRHFTNFSLSADATFPELQKHADTVLGFTVHGWRKLESSEQNKKWSLLITLCPRPISSKMVPVRDTGQNRTWRCWEVVGPKLTFVSALPSQRCSGRQMVDKFVNKTDRWWIMNKTDTWWISLWIKRTDGG